MSETEALTEWVDDEPTNNRQLAVVDAGVAALNRGEVETQLDAAHKYARSIKRFMANAISLATINVATAESCIYALPRGGKTISGPSVRLAEVVASAYGNLHVATRVIDVGERELTAQAVAWDLQTNLRISIEVRRRITDKNGRKFNDDMVNVTAAAACSIALRNAIFRVIPRALIDQVYDRCRAVAVGDSKSLSTRRDEVLARLAKLGADKDRVLGALGLQGVEDIGMAELEHLIGMGTALKSGDVQLDEVFPPPVAAVPGAEQAGKKLSLRKDTEQ